MLDIPYGNGQFSLVVLLPYTGTLADVMNRLTLSDLNRWVAEADTLTPQLYLPRFKTTFKMRAESFLQQLGMRRPFAQDADFSGFFQNIDSGLRIDRVIHQSFIEVNEEGAEAAAATAVVITNRSTSQPEPCTIRVDRPFAYFIREKHTRAILFAGTLVNPSE